MPAIEPGRKAPAFSLQDQSGTTHRLKDYAGQPLVLYFYPKDDTPGCTREACAFRDALPAGGAPRPPAALCSRRRGGVRASRTLRLPPPVCPRPAGAVLLRAARDFGRARPPPPTPARVQPTSRRPNLRRPPAEPPGTS